MLTLLIHSSIHGKDLASGRFYILSLQDYIGFLCFRWCIFTHNYLWHNDKEIWKAVQGRGGCCYGIQGGNLCSFILVIKGRYLVDKKQNKIKQRSFLDSYYYTNILFVLPFSFSFKWKQYCCNVAVLFPTHTKMTLLLPYRRFHMSGKQYRIIS